MCCLTEWSVNFTHIQLPCQTDKSNVDKAGIWRGDYLDLVLTYYNSNCTIYAVTLNWLHSLNFHFFCEFGIKGNIGCGMFSKCSMLNYHKGNDHIFVFFFSDNTLHLYSSAQDCLRKC